MKNNLLNKNIIIYKINNKILLLISINNGWIFVPLNKNNNTQLQIIIFGFNRIYKFFFKIKGFGFKWKYQIHVEKLKEAIYFKLGFTHRISLITKYNNKYVLKKQRFVIKNRSYQYIRTHLNMLFLLYQNYLYNKKGIYLRGTKFKLKLSKKKSKF